MSERAKPQRLAVEKTYKIYIGGRFPRTESGRYYTVTNRRAGLVANVCRASRKDFRNAVVAARSAFPGWSAASAYLRGQILYRVAEMLEGRAAQFVDELAAQGVGRPAARREVAESIDLLIHFAGWSDKYQQIFSSVNPVSSSHFNFSMLEPTGVVGILAPEQSGLVGVVAAIAPVIVGGNTGVVLASHELPLSAVSFAEVLHASDVPAGVVNILTGRRDELAMQFASHMDVNALVCCEQEAAAPAELERAAADNIKRVIVRTPLDWSYATACNPYLIGDTQEVKTTWHPIGT